MPLLFVVLSNLYSSLEAIATQRPPLPPRAVKYQSEQEIRRWFRDNSTLINDPDTSAAALLSSLLPEKRTDRVYGLQSRSLTKLLQRCFLLGSSRKADLQRCLQPGGGDLATCVERVLTQTPSPACSVDSVTVEQVDAFLHRIASRSRFSSPEVRNQNLGHAARPMHEELSSIYDSLKAQQAKWFTRLILKDLGPIMISESVVLHSVHWSLPSVMKLHDNFEAAVAICQKTRISLSSVSSKLEERTQCGPTMKDLVPIIGTKIQRPIFLQGRSIKHVTSLAHGRRMSLERKYDGEYCQIHINLQNGGSEIRLFSKSGKDSTADRHGLHGTIRECLRIGEENCGFSNQCILEGEMLIWSGQENGILPFHKIRKHISRSGGFIGTAKDSQAHAWEHLMIVFFDVMLIDDQATLSRPYDQRKKALEELVTLIPGRSDLAARHEISFSSRTAPQQLLESLASVFSKNWEGCVLKPCDEPYVNLQPQKNGEFRSCWIKLKKDYLPGLGDTAEMAVLGAGYNAAEATKLGITHLRWTHFHVGCLMNKLEVLQYGAKPNFKVLDATNQGIKRDDMERLCALGQFRALDVLSKEAREGFDFSIGSQHSCKMDVVFREPFVFEVMGGGFDKPGNEDYFVLRFPRVLKIHWDRNFKDTIGFDELQAIAAESMEVSDGDLGAEVAEWIERIRASERGTRQKRLPWDDSQDEVGSGSTDDDLHPPSPSLKRKGNLSPLFIRMDEAEMLTHGTRRGTNSITSRTYSANSASRCQGATNLPTSRVSSPPMAPQSPPIRLMEQGSARPKPGGRKRSLEESDSTPSPRSSKTCRLSSPRTGLIEGYVSPPSTTTGRLSKPLGDLPNPPSHRRLYQSFRTKDSSICSTSRLQVSPPSTIRSTILPAVKHHSIRKPKHSPSSASTILRETTSEARSSGTSQGLNISSAVVASPPLCNSFSTAMSSSVRVLTSSASRSSPANADYENTVFVVAPCLSNLRLLHDMPTVATATDLTKLEHASKQVMALIDTHPEGLSGRFLRTLCPFVEETGREVEIWDYSVLELGLDGGQAKFKENCFVGIMKREEEVRGEKSLAGDVIVEWRIGGVSRVRKAGSNALRKE